MRGRRARPPRGSSAAYGLHILDSAAWRNAMALSARNLSAETQLMSEAISPEQRAEALVTVGPREPGGFWFVRLQEVVNPAVLLGPYENPSLAKEEAARVRTFVAAVIREAQQTTG